MRVSTMNICCDTQSKCVLYRLEISMVKKWFAIADILL